jgi:SET domain-containing protein
LDELSKVIARIEFNTFGLLSCGDKTCSYAILSPGAAVFNHSCIPNAKASLVGNGIHIIATRDIHPSEEINISYIDSDIPLVNRQKSLFNKYLFHCGCPKCMAG